MKYGQKLYGHHAELKLIVVKIIDSKKNDIWKQWTHSQKLKQMKFNFWDQTSFDQLGLISDPGKNFQNPEWVHDHKGLENIDCTIVKYGETFYGRLTALTPAEAKVNRFLKRMTIESDEHTKLKQMKRSVIIIFHHFGFQVKLEM